MSIQDLEQQIEKKKAELKELEDKLGSEKKKDIDYRDSYIYKDLNFDLNDYTSELHKYFCLCRQALALRDLIWKQYGKPDLYKNYLIDIEDKKDIITYYYSFYFDNFTNEVELDKTPTPSNPFYFKCETSCNLFIEKIGKENIENLLSAKEL